ncbi:MAG: NADH-quinone oxidoreductase subunit NuoB [Lentisphaerae bacterium]|nr:NADH-quinone oxidoreductase subunit NuoB [Lentisphaerota bacterium]
MNSVLRTRISQGHRTMRYPAGPLPDLPERFAGRPRIDAGKCRSDCSKCVAACPAEAISRGASGNGPELDTGRCIFCGSCLKACEYGAMEFGRSHQLASAKRDDLVVTAADSNVPSAFKENVRRLFGRSLKLRQVSAGGCNACEADTNVLNTLAWDLGRFGIQFVASPRHADGLLITGPVSVNMELALRKTYEAVAEPKIVIAVGACAISGGIFRTHAETRGGADSVVPVDLYVPGCPPHPLTILDGLLRLLGRLSDTGV